jgi:hypothetical protein
VKKLLLLAASLSLAACGDAPASDGYTFGSKQYTKDSVQVTVIQYPSLQALNKQARSLGVDSEVQAFAVLRPPFDSCTIHIVDPSVKYMPEFIGHEFTHCIHGQWHTNNQSFK